MSIIRIKHNRENPYVQLNKQTLFDEEISLRAKGLWAQCLARPDDWQFRVSEMEKKCKEGRRALYSTIDELIEKGYAIRLEHSTKGQDGKFASRSVEYIFFEFKATEEEKAFYIEEFKKSFRECGFGDLGGGDLGSAPILKKDSKEIDITNIDSCPRSETESETTDPIPSKEKKKDSFSLEDMRIAKLLWESILARNPTHKPPKLEKWAGDIRLAVERDNRTYAELEEMIRWIATKSQFWAKNILSAEKLRIQFDRIKLEMKPPETEDVVSKTNMNTAMKVRDILGRDCTIAVYRESVRNLQTGDSIPMNLPVETFETILLKWTGLRRKNG